MCSAQAMVYWYLIISHPEPFSTGSTKGLSIKFLLKKTEHKILDETIAEPEEEEIEDEYAEIYCKLCGYPVTKIEYMTARQGSHRHVFTNPAGITFEIGLFNEAHGCVNITEPTFEHTWFKGYAWSVSVCRGCGNHLGWFWQGIEDKFYGLILDRIIEGPVTH